MVRCAREPDSFDKSSISGKSARFARDRFRPLLAAASSDLLRARLGGSFVAALTGALFLFGNAALLLRAAYVTIPLYPGDELTHWQNSRFLAAHLAPEQFDPNLPRMGNYLYFLLTEWLAQAPEGPTAMRMLNYLFIALSAVFTWRIARLVIPSPLATLAGSFVFSFGCTTYSVGVMPETMFMCLFLGLAAFMVYAWAPHRPGASFVAGVIVAALLLVKPHGVAIFLSTGLTMVVSAVILGDRFKQATKIVLDLLAFSAGTLVAICAIASLAQGRPVLSPTVFVGGLYGSILSATDSTPILLTLLDVIRYFAAHCTVLLLFFAPAAIIAPAIACSLFDKGRPGANDALEMRPLVMILLFTTLSALGAFAMISIFSHIAGSQLPFEANRIHGRYWSFLLPLFVTLTIASFHLLKRSARISPRLGSGLERAAGLAWLLAITVFAFAVAPSFSIYPWDFPDLFAFYRPNPGGWNYGPWIPFSFLLVTTLLAVCALVLALKLPGRRLSCVASLAAVFVIGNINTTGWQYDIMPDIRPLVTAGETATGLVGRRSEGLFVTPEYWGRTPYVLFQLPLRSFVSVKPANAALTDADVPATAAWVLTMSSYDVQFAYREKISLGSLTLFLRRSGS